MALDKRKLSKAVKDKYSFANETFFHTAKSNPKDKIDVEIGDSKQVDFKPQFKVMRWDNEVNFSMRAVEHPQATVETEGEKIKYRTPDYEVHQYDKPIVAEDGGFEFEWFLPKKPKSNVLTATIQTKGLDFFYQPKLTPEEIAEGAFRPENVIGSYAAYHQTKGGLNDANGKDYKTGKAFHIYRPEAVDAQGNKTWCDLLVDVDRGLVVVTVPQEFLESCVYPVIVDPTFGYTSIGATASTQGNNGSKFTSPSDMGTLDSITAYVQDVPSLDNESIRAVVLDSSANLIRAGEIKTITTSLAWQTFSFETVVIREIVVASGDDGRWYQGTSSFLNTGSAAPFFGYDSTSSFGEINSFVRFTNVDIPPGATITSAVITMQANSSDSNTTVNATISAIDADNAAAPTDYSGAEGATRTTASVAWNSVGAWTAGTNYNSPDISSVIQEVVDRAGWAYKNALVIYFENNGSTVGSSIYRRAKSYDTSTTACAILKVTYTIAGLDLSASTDYILGYSIATATNGRYDTGSSGQGYEKTGASVANLYNPDFSSATNDTKKKSIYATYTASGGSDPTPLRMLMGMGT